MNNNKFIWGAIAVVFIVAVIALFSGGSVSTIVKNVPFVGGTTNYDSLSLSNDLTVSGTTTIARSFDGFVIYDDFSLATGTSKAVYTHAGSPAYCQEGVLYATTTNGTYNLAPSLIFSLGTTSSATGYSTNILASTTMATSTGRIVPLYSGFVLRPGDVITGAISDAVSNASSTYLGNWQVEFGYHCWELGG
jgi:hypothetical protein